MCRFRETHSHVRNACQTYTTSSAIIHQAQNKKKLENILECLLRFYSRAKDLLKGKKKENIEHCH